jgi:hypothetical protein
MSTSLRNSSTWPCIESFLSEYQLIHDKIMLRQLTRVAFAPNGDSDTNSTPMADHIVYTYMGDHAYGFDELVAKKQFLKWIYALFFRIVLPFNVKMDEFQPAVLSTVNTTILFRLVSQLRIVGYPSHWLSEVITNIIESKVTTISRPPRTTLTTPQAVKREHPEKHLSTKPFSHEMAVIARLCQPILPFTLTSLPLSSEISLYTFNLYENLHSYNPSPHSSHFSLIFFDPSALLDLGYNTTLEFATNARPLLDPSWGEVDSDYHTAKHHAFREKGVIVYSTFRFEKETGLLEAWMDGKIVDMMVREGWNLNVFRTDSWAWAFGEEVEVRECVSKGVSWEEFMLKGDEMKIDE